MMLLLTCPLVDGEPYFPDSPCKPYPFPSESEFIPSPSHRTATRWPPPVRMVSRIWNLANGEVRQWISLQETSCGHELLYLDQDRILVAGYGIHWWDIPANGWNQISPLNLWRRQLAMSPDGRYLAVADEAESVDWAQNGLFVFNSDGWTSPASV